MNVSNDGDRPDRAPDAIPTPDPPGRAAIYAGAGRLPDPPSPGSAEPTVTR